VTPSLEPIEPAPSEDGRPDLDLAAGWEPLTDDVDELRTRLTAAMHERLRLIDWVRGLEAELATVRDRYADGDVEELARRLDELQIRYDDHVESARIAVARAQERVQHELDQSIAEVKRSLTWRIGSAVLAPIRRVRGAR
jgi:predicted nuclease with TOPRIM domain